MRENVLNALRQLPALARGGAYRAARRYVRKVAAAAVEPAAPPKKRRLRDDGVRLFTLSRLRRDDVAPPSEPGAYVPYLRMSGRRLERHGFQAGALVYVTAEEGRLILTNVDPRLPKPRATDRHAIHASSD